MKNTITLVVGMLVLGGFAACAAASPEASLKYGLYIHYGPRTFLRQGEKVPLPADRFTPPASLDVRTWAKTAKESGMTFAILTAKHEDGFCLWPAKDDGYSVSGSPGKRDLVGEFVSACRAEGIAPGIHYSFPDVYNWEAGGKKVSAAYFGIISRHFDDLLGRYPELKVLCLDGSAMLSASQLAELKSIIRKRNRSCIVWDNWGVQGPGHFIGTTIRGWFWQPRYHVTSAQRILNEMESARKKGKAYVLNVGPAPDGRIPDDQMVMLGAVRAKAPQQSQTAAAETGQGADAQGSGGGTAAAGNSSPLGMLSQQAPNAMEWALAPLDQAVPGGIRQNLKLLREDLLDEAKARPAAAPEAYELGRRLCDALVSVFDERDATLVRTGYRAAQADANSEVTSQALEARRNHLMSWPQYAREKDQAAEIFRQQMNRAALTKELPKVEWAKRTAILRKGLDSLYSKYRDALR